MSTARRAHQLTEPVAHHGEGAFWDRVGSRWLSVDMLAGRVLVTGTDGATRAVALPDPVAAAVRPVEDGGLLVVGERSLWWVDVDRDGGSEALLALDVGEGCRANEAAVTPAGGLVVGTMSYDAAPGRGRVICVDPHGRCTTAYDGTTVSNGTVLLDAGTVLFVDSPTRQVVRLSVRPDGTWADPVPVADLASQPGVPDGICVDADGGVWVALWGGGCVQRWSNEGELTDVVALPVSQPTSVALGGPDGRSLLVTTSDYDLPAGHGTPAGALFEVAVDVPAGRHDVVPSSTLRSWRRHDDGPGRE